MVISKDQAGEIKKQLFEQVEKLPNENKEQIKEYIKGLNEEELEEFLKKNKIELSSDKESSQKEESSSECIFCSIIKNKIPSYKIAETKKELAILEINPLSRGHLIVLPKDHVTIEKLPKSALGLAQKLAKKIKKKLKPQDIKIESSSLMNHAMINIIPIYDKAPLKKIKAEEKELILLKSKLETKKRSSRKKQKETENKKEKKENEPNLPKIKFRIP